MSVVGAILKRARSSVALASIILAAGFAVPLIAFFIVGSAQASREADVRRAAEVSAKLETLRAAEARRPWYQYQRFYHDPLAIDNGGSLLPSPLATEHGRDPLVGSWFAIDKDGHASAPADGDDRCLATVLAAQDVLRRAATETDRDLAESQTLAEGAYYQNVNPGQVRTDIDQGKFNAYSVARGDVIVHVGAMHFLVLALGGENRPELVGVRTVRTPGGLLVQGFVVRWDTFGVDVTVALDSSTHTRKDGVSVPIDLRAGSLRVSAGTTSLRSFYTQFALIVAICAVACVAILVLVVQNQRLARERSRFAAVAAHELRTPLAGLRLYAEMLAEGLGDPSATTAYARRIADEAARLTRVVSNVLGFARIEQQRGRLELSAVRAGELAPLIREEVARSLLSVEALGATLTSKIADTRPCLFDPDAVVQIVQNLVDNAEKYSRNRDSNNHVEARTNRAIHILLEERTAQGCVALIVEDRGPGVEGALAPRLFEAFARGSSPDAPAGVGLGLSIGRALARAQGGDLVHAARAGGGSTFTLTLPLA